MLRQKLTSFRNATAVAALCAAGSVGLLTTAASPAAAASFQSCWWPTTTWPCSTGLMAGGGSDNSGWLGNPSWLPSMDNASTGTAKRLEAYQNGVGLVGAWNRGVSGDPTWSVNFTGYSGGGNAYTCKNRSTGSVNVKCWSWLGS